MTNQVNDRIYLADLSPRKKLMPAVESVSGAAVRLSAFARHVAEVSGRPLHLHAAADLLVLASRAETYGMVVTEAAIMMHTVASGGGGQAGRAGDRPGHIARTR